MSNPAFVTVGSFEPFTPAHAVSLKRLARAARRQRMASVAVMLDPPPAALLNGQRRWPLFDDATARRDLVLGSGIDAVLHMRFSRADLDLGARDLIDEIAEHVSVRSLWVGRRQSFGSGPQGSTAAMRDLANERGFSMRFLPGATASEGAEARELLGSGQVRAASVLLGRSPRWHKPRGQRLVSAWPPGVYGVEVVDRANARKHEAQLVFAARPDGSSEARWIREAAAVVVLRGPADRST